MPAALLRNVATLALALAAALLCVGLHTPIPWMIGPLLATSIASICDAPTRSWPPLRNAAQWGLAASLGLYFTPQVTTLVAGLWWAIALGTVGMVVLCAALALVLAWGTGLNVGTLILGTSPGGIAEMAVTARALQLGVPVVTAFQVVRLVAVLFLVEPLYRWGNPR